MIKAPLLKEYFKLEDWAFKNNLHVHPEYIKAIKRKERLLVWIVAFGTVITVITMKIIVTIIMELIK